MNNNQSFGFNWNEKASREIEDLEGYYYHDLDIEPGKKSTWLYYNQSLKELRSKDYERHLMPWESFGLIIDYLENKLSGDLETLAEDMTEGCGCGEWFDLFMERKDDKLFCYVPNTILEPEDVKWDEWNEDGYEIKRKKLKLDKEFDISGISSEQWVSLEKFPKEFVKYIYTREFDDLPEEMKTGNEKAQVCLPPENVLWPVGRGVYSGLRFYIHSYDGIWASRGVRK